MLFFIEPWDKICPTYIQFINTCRIS